MRRLLLALGVLAMLLSVQEARAQIACGPLPYTFSNGTLADANQVNADFNAIITCLTGATTVTVSGSPTANHVASFSSGTVLQDAGFTAYHDSHSNFGIGGTTFGAAITTGGVQNTADGDAALLACTSCSLNTAMGYQAATSRTTGRAGTYLGWAAGQNDTTGSSNTFLGAFAGQGFFYTGIPLTGSDNTCTGEAACITINGTAFGNDVSGYASAFNLTTGQYNSLHGIDAGQMITTQTDDSVMGANAYAFAQGTLDLVLGSGAGSGYAIPQTITTNSTGTTLLMSNTTGFHNGDQIFTSLTPTGTTITGVNPGVSVTISNPLTNTLIAGSTVYDLPSPYVGTENIFLGTDAGFSVSGNFTHTIGIGHQACLNQGTGGGDDICVGYRSLAGDLLGGTTGSPLQTVAIGSHAGEFFLGTNSVILGWDAGSIGAAFSQSLLAGALAGGHITSSTGNLTLLGYNTGASINAANNVVLLGSGVDDSGDVSNYMNLDNIITTTGAAVPGTSITTIAGNVLLGASQSYLAWGTTSSFPRLERDSTGAELDVVLGDNSAFTVLHVLGVNIGSGVSSPGVTCAVNTPAHLTVSHGIVTLCN